VWSTETGFGGNGEPTTNEDLAGHHRSCVTSGPFADFEVKWLSNDFRPHCLTRNFANATHLKKLSQNMKPAVVNELLDQDDYEAFNLRLEHSHNSIPASILGDFAHFTAPNGKRLPFLRSTTANQSIDPIFYLHHTQIDRLWWTWQQRHPNSNQYVGKANRNSTAIATLEDIIPMGGLAADIRVHEVINTQSGLLCYKY
jgi:tyrosinase